MTDDQLDLDAIDARAAAASAGPWTYDASEPSDVVIWGKADPDNPEHADGVFLANVGASRFGQVGVAFDIDDANGRFIAAARSDVPALVARVRELEDRIERARKHAPAQLEAAMNRAEVAYLFLERLAVECDAANDPFGGFIRDHIEPFWDALPEATMRRLNRERARKCCNCPALDGAGDDNG